MRIGEDTGIINLVFINEFSDLITYFDQILTDGLNDIKVNIESDKRDRQKAEVEFEQRSNGIDVVVSGLGDICVLTLCCEKIKFALW